MSSVARGTYGRSSPNSIYSASSSSSRNSSRSGGGSQVGYHPGSYAGSHIGMTNAGIANPVQRIGYVDNMPPHEWFTTGESRQPEQRQVWSLQYLSSTSTGASTSMRGLHAVGYEVQQPKSRRSLGGSGGVPWSGSQYFDDAASVAPSDSISNAPSARSGGSRHSRRSKRSSHSSQRRDSLLDGPGNLLGSSYRPIGEEFGADEQAYEDEVNDCVTRNVLPGYRR